MTFLLDERQPPHALFEDVDDAALAHFALGERHRHALQTEEAIAAFQKSLDQDPNEWLRQSARARLKELRSIPLTAAGRSN